MTHILLVGNPNCGKTTLFNALTGSNQRVGNWPGVTVEKKTGHFSINEQLIQVTDLPGIYSLTSPSGGSSLDEQIATDALINLDADIIVNVIDACSLERHLYLTSQLLELAKPMIVVLNMMDITKQRGITINVAQLSQQLHCPVIAVQAHKQIGLNDLYQAIETTPEFLSALALNLPPVLLNELDALKKQLIEQDINPDQANYYAYRILEGDNRLAQEFLDLPLCSAESDILLADARYQTIHQIVAKVQKKHSDTSEHVTAKLDRIILHRYLAIPLFFLMMYLMFLFAINIGGAFQDFFDITTNVVFVQGVAWLLQQVHAPAWLVALLANGVGKGINTTLTFIPVIAAMFFFLSLLEASGYMARAAFVVDKAMRVLGLPGKAFVPMIVGFGCNVPAIMAARTLDSERDRILTVLMSPFMSCSARLAIYAVFVAAFFPSGGQNVVFSLYLIGILMAVLTGFILRKTTLKGQASPLILELPAYHKPALKRLFNETMLRLRHFVVRAGRLIIPVCVILGGLNALTIDGTVDFADANNRSVLSMLGQFLTPIFAPMGLQQDNWPATVGLLTGMLAKEVVIGSLNALYTQLGHLSEITPVHFDFLGALQAALWSIPQNLAHLGHALSNPILASLPFDANAQSSYGMMVKRFDGQAGAYAYLLFILLYIPCVSTMAVIRQEANRRLMWFSIIWSLIVAYCSAVLFYQLATFTIHPRQSMLWLLVILSSAGLIFGFLRFRTLDLGVSHVTKNS